VRRQKALKTIQNCVANDNYEVTEHFIDEMKEDAFFFVDIENSILENPRICDKGCDDKGNPKFEIQGKSTNGRRIGIICSVKQNNVGLLITIYEAE